MRILHTADLHLREDAPETIDALDAVLEAARTRDADLVTVGGDLFDRPTDVDALRPALRERFADAGREVLVVPGNHDAAAFRRNLDFGPTVDPLVGAPCDSRRVGEATVVGVPYTSEFTDELYAALREAAPADGPGVLLLHCTLDVGFDRDAVGTEETTRYCPVSRSVLGELGYDAVLAGHIHAGLDRRRLPGGGHFVYPGSPCSHTTAETGPRHAVVYDTAADALEPVRLPTFYHDRRRWTVRPGEGAAVLDEVDRWVADREADDCEYRVAVDGFVRDEAAFGERLATIVPGDRLTNEVRDVGPVLDHELYERFERRLAEREDVDDPEAVRAVVTRALSDLLIAGEVRP